MYVFFCSDDQGLRRFTIFFVVEQVLRIFNEISANYTEDSRRTRRKLMTGHWRISTDQGVRWWSLYVILDGQFEQRNQSDHSGSRNGAAGAATAGAAGRGSMAAAGHIYRQLQ